MKDYEKVLQGIGLTQGEVKVYLTLLRIGETTTGKIIELSGLSSGKIYEILDKLIQKGLANFIIKEKTKYFNATSPNKILEYIEEKDKEIQKKRRQAQDILPELFSLKESKLKESSAVIYRGFHGFKSAIYEALEALDKNDDWIAFGVGLDLPKKFNVVWNEFNKKLVKKKISIKVIVTTKDLLKGLKIPRLMEVRIIPNNATAPMSISGDIVLIYNWKELSVIKIRDAEVADSMREFFKSLWEISKKP